mgnify:CR=1 FL=1
MRARVTQTAPVTDRVEVHWRHGGEGLGGTVVKGSFTADDKSPLVPIGEWSAWARWLPITSRPAVRNFAFSSVEL